MLNGPKLYDGYRLLLVDLSIVAVNELDGELKDAWKISFKLICSA